MIFKFLLVSDEAEGFFREIEIDSEAKFSNFHQAILDSVDYRNDMITSFFLCNDRWEKEQEVTLMEMDTTSDIDNYVMDETVLSELISEEGQKLLYVFDMLSDRAFFIELKEIITGRDLDAPVCTYSQGQAPEQSKIESLEDLAKNTTTGNAAGIDENFFGDESFDMEELDADGFSDLDFDNEGDF